MLRAFWVGAGIALSVVACGGNVVVDGSGDTSSGTSSGVGGAPASGSSSASTTGSTSSSSGIGGFPVGAPIFALVTRSPSADGPCSNDGEGPAPGGSYVVVANKAISCSADLPADIVASTEPTSEVWEICFQLPSSTLTAGSSFSVGSAILSGFADAAPDGTSGSWCSSMQNIASGTLPVDAVAPGHASINLTSVVQSSCAGPALAIDGDYTAVRCP